MECTSPLRSFGAAFALIKKQRPKKQESGRRQARPPRNVPEVRYAQPALFTSLPAVHAACRNVLPTRASRSNDARQPSPPSSTTYRAATRHRKVARCWRRGDTRNMPKRADPSAESDILLPASSFLQLPEQLPGVPLAGTTKVGGGSGLAQLLAGQSSVWRGGRKLHGIPQSVLQRRRWLSRPPPRSRHGRRRVSSRGRRQSLTGLAAQLERARVEQAAGHSRGKTPLALEQYGRLPRLGGWRRPVFPARRTLPVWAVASGGPA